MEGLWRMMLHCEVRVVSGRLAKGHGSRNGQGGGGCSLTVGSQSLRVLG
eukprot:COSAG02_NODE_1025_length_15146_cov_21.959460_15_plen_49_part_00